VIPHPKLLPYPPGWNAAHHPNAVATEMLMGEVWAGHDLPGWNLTMPDPIQVRIWDGHSQPASPNGLRWDVHEEQDEDRRWGLCFGAPRPNNGNPIGGIWDDSRLVYDHHPYERWLEEGRDEVRVLPPPY
jgi:hypothetical protein